MKNYLTATVLGVALGMPTLAGSAVPSTTGIYSQTRLDPMSDCEMQYYRICMVVIGDHGYCMDQVEMHVCFAH